MLVKQVAELLDATFLVEGDEIEAQVETVVASDLMSDVLVVDKDNILLMTALASDQSVRTAHVIGAVGVVIVGGKPLPESTAVLAKKLGVSLAISPLDQFDACARVSPFLHS